MPDPDPDPDLTPERYQRACDLYLAAQVTEPAERETFIRQGAGGDESLARLALDFLAASDQAVGLLDQPRWADLVELPAFSEPAPPATPSRIGPYRILRKLGEGGMGTVYLAETVHPRRQVAVKVIRPGLATRSGRERFKREAQLLAMAQHPGIATLYTAGEAEPEFESLPYLAMEFVQGEPLDRYVAAQPERRRCALELVAEVADAVHHAHQSGILHRDLKPANILVEPGGRPKVLDFGVARAFGETATGATLHSAEGALAGTPLYMSPEQVDGHNRELDGRSDVYALGVILFQLLVGRPPYDLTGLNQMSALRRIRDTRPPRLSWLEPSLRGDLELIVDKAMADDRNRRYATAGDLAADIRRFLSGWPVEARPPSFGYLLKMAIARNRPAFATAAAGLALALGLVGLYVSQLAADRVRLAELRDLSLTEDHRRLVVEQEELWPALPENVPAMLAWLERARTIRDHLPALHDEIDKLVRRSLPYNLGTRERDQRSHPDWEAFTRLGRRLGKLRELQEMERTGLPVPVKPLFKPKSGKEYANLPKPPSLGVRIERTEAEIELLRERIDRARSKVFADSADQWWHDTLAKLVLDLERFGDPEHGLLVGRNPDAGPGVARRVREAYRTHWSSLVDPVAAASWAAAAAYARTSPLYGGLDLPPQSGLLPIGVDPASGLLEFWHVATGARPGRLPSGELDFAIDTGVILVLIPGGSFAMGAQREDPAGPNYDPDANWREGPVHEVTLDPFLISKYLVSQGQWLHWTGDNPSYASPADAPLFVRDLTHPLDSVIWQPGRRVLRRFGFDHPTEAQLEYATRAGTSTPFWCGVRGDDLKDYMNVADQALADSPTPPYGYYAEEWNDGFTMHAPVDALLPNPWGLYHVHGNLWQWTRDYFGLYHEPVADGDGERLAGIENHVTIRGGAYVYVASLARSAMRHDPMAWSSALGRGMRPTRALEDRAAFERRLARIRAAGQGAR